MFQCKKWQKLKSNQESSFVSHSRKTTCKLQNLEKIKTSFTLVKRLRDLLTQFCAIQFLFSAHATSAKTNQKIPKHKTSDQSLFSRWGFIWSLHPRCLTWTDRSLTNFPNWLLDQKMAKRSKSTIYCLFRGAIFPKLCFTNHFCKMKISSFPAISVFKNFKCFVNS